MLLLLDWTASREQNVHVQEVVKHVPKFHIQEARPLRAPCTPCVHAPHSMFGPNLLTLRSGTKWTTSLVCDSNTACGAVSGLMVGRAGGAEDRAVADLSIRHNPLAHGLDRLANPLEVKRSFAKKLTRVINLREWALRLAESPQPSCAQKREREMVLLTNGKRRRPRSKRRAERAAKCRRLQQAIEDATPCNTARPLGLIIDDGLAAFEASKLPSRFNSLATLSSVGEKGQSSMRSVCCKELILCRLCGDLHEAYYRHQLVLPSEEWRKLCNTLRQPMPVAFRLCKGRGREGVHLGKHLHPSPPHLGRVCF
eukprot:6489076-Amphidinium_carterae.1